MTAGPTAEPTWESALDRLQDDLTAAEHAHLAHDSFQVARWEPPLLTTPLPAHLVDRARDLHARQEALIALLGDERDRARRQLEVTRRINQTTGTASRPATTFFDASA